MSDKNNIPFYLFLTCLFVALKMWHTSADNNELLFLLRPVDYLISLVTSSSSVFLPSEGFYHPNLNLLIDKSCSGFNFFLLLYLLLSFLALSFVNKYKNKIFSLAGLFLASYLFTLFVNSSRILVSIAISSTPLAPIAKNISWLHQAEGIFIYLFFLVAIYLFSEYLFKKLPQNVTS